MSKTQNEIIQICDSVRDLLLEKNRKYGDSALEPVRVMSRSTPVEQILVRIDDKLSRISRGTGLVGDDEDVITDLIGYFVLLKIALGRQNGEEDRVSDHVPFSVTYDDILNASRQDLEDRGEEFHVECIAVCNLAEELNLPEHAILDLCASFSRPVNSWFSIIDSDTAQKIRDAVKIEVEDRPLYSTTVEYLQDADIKHSPYYCDRNRNRTYTEWYPEDVECGWDPNSGPTC